MDEITATIINKEYFDRNQIEMEVYDGNETYIVPLWKLKYNLTCDDERLRMVADIVIKKRMENILNYPLLDFPVEVPNYNTRTDEEILADLNNK